jgi:hypothetical protein
MNADDIYSKVNAFRAACEQAATSLDNEGDYGFFSKFPDGQCFHTSYLVAEFLVHECGIVRDSIFVIVNANRTYKSREESHAWVRIDSQIVDITDDQFEDRDKPTILTSDSTWHDQWDGAEENQLVSLDNEDEDVAYLYWCLYEVIINFIDKH